MFSASSILGPTFGAMSFALDGLALRQQARAENLANIDTPGFRARTVDFERSLRAAMDQSQDVAPHLPRLADGAGLPGAIDTAMTGGLLAADSEKSGPFARPELSMETVGGAPNRITETTGMLEDTIMFRLMSQQVTNKINGLKNVISEMGRA